MDNTARIFEDVCAEVYLDNYIEPTNRWINPNAKDLKMEFRRLKTKQNQAKEILQQDLQRDKFTRKSKCRLMFEFNGKIFPANEVDMQLTLSLGGCFFVNHFMDIVKGFFLFMKLLEDGSYVPQEVQEEMGVLIDYSPISLWSYRHIRWQAAAQVLWFHKPQSNIKNIQDEMLADRYLVELLDLRVLTSINNPETRGRGLEDIIRMINPIQGSRRGRPSKVKSIPPKDNHVISIPGIYNNQTKKVNMRGLKVAIMTIAKLLELRNEPYEQITGHPVIAAYKDLTSSIFGIFINEWIREGLSKQCHASDSITSD